MQTIQKKDNKQIIYLYLKKMSEKFLNNKQRHSLKRYIYKKRLKNAYKYDRDILLNSAFGIVSEMSFENLRAKITLHYHSIEKGISNENVRLGFGKNALNDLFYSLDLYIEKKFPLDDSRFQNAINILKHYVDYHQKRNYAVPMVEKKLNSYVTLIKKEISSGKNGYREISLEDLSNKELFSFEDLVKTRMSVRDYSDQPVDNQDIIDAIELSIHTPSVCNRQPWKVYIIKEYNKIQKALEIQRGMNEERRKNTNTLLAITCDVSISQVIEREMKYL